MTSTYLDTVNKHFVIRTEDLANNTGGCQLRVLQDQFCCHSMWGPDSLILITLAYFELPNSDDNDYQKSACLNPIVGHELPETRIFAIQVPRESSMSWEFHTQQCYCFVAVKTVLGFKELGLFKARDKKTIIKPARQVHLWLWHLHFSSEQDRLGTDTGKFYVKKRSSFRISKDIVHSCSRIT